MRLPHAVPVIQDAVFRLGLSNEEIAYLLETEVEHRHLQRGQLVRAYVRLDGESPNIAVYELPPLGSTRPETQIRVPLQPDPQRFLARVESFRRAKTGKLGWEAVLARCLGVEEGYSVLELRDHPLLEGQSAVLPHSRLAANDRQSWRKGLVRYVAVCRAPNEHRDGLDPWHQLNPRWLATRGDSIFLPEYRTKFRHK